MSISKPDARARAAEILGGTEPGASPAPAAPEIPRKRGRPPGSKTKKLDKPVIQERTSEDIEQGKKICAFLAATLWGIGAPLMKRRDITDEEALQLGAAIDPVLAKYLPGLTGYGLELNLILVVAVIWKSTEIKKDAEKTDKPEKGKKNLPGNAGGSAVPPESPPRLDLVE